MNLSALASKDVVSVTPSDSLDKAIELMEEHAIHHLPVVGTEGVVGILSDRDLLVSVGWLLSGERRIERGRGNLAGPANVAQIMTTPVVTMTADQSVSEAAQQMIERRISAIVLVRAKQVLGIITKFDLLRHTSELTQDMGAPSALEDLVGQHMRTDVCSLGPEDSILKASSTMRERGLRHIPVIVDESVVGILSDRDLRRACGIELIEDEQADDRGEVYVAGSTVMEIMSYEVQTVTPEDTVRVAADTMARHRIGALPVVESGKLAGIITDTDLVRLLVQKNAL